MWYLTVLILAVVAIATWFFFKQAMPAKALDVNNDGKVNTDDVKAVVDVNQDGKVNVADVKVAAVEAAVEAKEVVVETAAKVATKAKKATTKKAAPKSTRAKK